MSAARSTEPGIPLWYGALTTLLEPLGARWGQKGDRAAVRARRALDVPVGDAWIHVASVGEASGVPPLVAEWRRRRPGERLVGSALTPGGRSALARIADFPVTAPPYDAPGAARRACRLSGIRRLVLLETEIWPAWIAASTDAGAHVAVVNGRLSDRSWPIYRRLAGSLAPLLSRLTAVAAQSERDADRWRALGVPAERVRVTGNTKHEALAAAEPPSAAERADVRRRLGLDDDVIWCVWGSLRPGEERWLEECLTRVPAAVRFLVVPRHPDRWRGRRLAGTEDGRAVWLLSLGVLPEAYRAGDLAVVGGTLERFGGHNPVEPASLGLPVLLGPSIENIGEAATALENAGGSRSVSNPASLAEAIAAWTANPAVLRAAGEAALRAALGLRGASSRALDWLEESGMWT